ncbi:MAG: UDP-N-acetylglucosamine 2-epimerase (non-hydrolyzing) [Nitrospira sp. BO4]|jgi:UDP-N-acetylglucosamine 2-epimerase|nr:UDP-N-acetylglucosamine 2-epimerase (non-hydrolyzing) [Nitrospira sp. BO4]
MKCVSIVGARPQFIKASPLTIALRKRSEEILVHTGQHYDHGMSDVFFEDLGIPAPNYHLGIGSGSHGMQTGAMLKAVEEVLQKEQPDVVIVYGDTNSTLAAALAAAKLNIPVAHVEAGLRSFNRMMPEEINRVMTDHLSTWLFAPSAVSRDNLRREGIETGVHVVGDIMYDALLLHRASAERRSNILRRLDLSPRSYYVATIHRAENTDHPDRLRSILQAFQTVKKPVILPLHPRTKKKLNEYAVHVGNNVRCMDPLGYLDMVQLQEHAACVLTDSGGVQKEAYYLRIPCVTFRTETEWIETVTAGWNIVCGSDTAAIVNAVDKMERCQAPHRSLYGDGRTTERIVEVLTSRKE